MGLLCISSTIRFPMPARHSLGQSRFLEDHDAPGEGPDRVTFSFDFRKIRLPSSLLKIEKARKEKSYDYADQDNPPPKTISAMIPMLVCFGKASLVVSDS